MIAEPLLHELETLTHTARIRQMVDCGRAAKHDPQVAAALTALEKGDFYARFLAIYSCFGSRDGAHILRALADPSRIIRGVAIKLVPLACDAEQQRQALEIIPRADRLPLLWKLRHLGNQPVIDAFLEQMAEAGDLQLRHLLPCGSPTLVRRYIPRIRPFMGLADWRRLTRHHPAIAFEILQARATSANGLDLQLVAFVNAILPILVRKKPDMALELVQTLAPVVSLNRLDLRALLVARPVPFVDFVLQQSSDLGDLDLSVIAHKLQNEHLLSLQATYPAHLDYYPPEWWLRRIPPARRTELYPIFQHIWHDRFRNRHVPAEIVALLPHPQREQEGRRLQALPSLAMHPEERLAYAVLLPWNEALGVLDPFLRDPGERVRTIALQTLVQLARYEREHVLDVLEMLQGHLHEPDPVWRVVLDHLCELPRGLWRREHLAAVEPILQGTLNTFGVSSNSFAALFLLITRFLDCAPEWSAAQFAQAAWVHGIVFQYGCIDNRLSDADVRQLGPALRPVLMSWAEKGLEEKLQELLSTFGKRVRVFEELLDALERIFTRKISFDFGNEILSTLIAYRPARAAQLLPELLQGNRTWITYPAVLSYLVTQRQDLLTPFLTYQKYSNLLNEDQQKSNWRTWRSPRPLTRGYARWTARQQASFARTLLKVIQDSTNDHETIMRAITRLAALPAVPTRHLIALTSDQRPVVRDTALILLRTLDDTALALPTLQEALQDERAVRAAYALRPFLLAASPQQALAILRTVPLTRVTTAKEVMRLLGELPEEEAFQELLTLEQHPLHRDVRATLLRALGRHLGRDEAWEILVRETRSEDNILALSTAGLSLSPPLAQAHHARKRFLRTRRESSGLQRFFWFAEWNTITMTHLSGEHLAHQAQQRLMQLFALLLARPELDVRAAVLRGCTRLPAADEDHTLLTRLLESMDTDNEEICEAAADAIFGTCMASDALVIEQAVRRLLPNRGALLEFTSVLHKAFAVNRQQLLPVIRGMIAALSADPLTIGLRVRLTIASLPWDEVASLLAEAAAAGTLHADALTQACSALEQTIGRYGRAGRTDIQEMSRLEEQLAASNDEHLRRIALAALVTQAEAAQSWSAEQRARLQVYRADPSALVASAAQFTMLPNLEA